MDFFPIIASEAKSLKSMESCIGHYLLLLAYVEAKGNEIKCSNHRK